jgi:hypothetical protein
LDPYQICTALIETACGNGFDPDKYGWENYKFQNGPAVPAPSAQSTLPIS